LADDWVRLTPSQNVALGFSRKARRYVLRSNLPTVQAIEVARAIAGAPGGELAGFMLEPSRTISARQYEQQRTGITKEARTKLLRKGKAKYRTRQAAETVKYKRRTMRVRNAIPNITRSDLKLFDFRLQHGWNAMDAKQKAAYRALWDKYPREEVLDALGSPVTT
jgi:hypothetical protein